MREVLIAVLLTTATPLPSPVIGPARTTTLQLKEPRLRWCDLARGPRLLESTRLSPPWVQRVPSCEVRFRLLSTEPALALPPQERQS